jgi:hypothetical protein
MLVHISRPKRWLAGLATRGSAFLFVLFFLCPTRFHVGCMHITSFFNVFCLAHGAGSLSHGSLGSLSCSDIPRRTR